MTGYHQVEKVQILIKRILDIAISLQIRACIIDHLTNRQAKEERT